MDHSSIGVVSSISSNGRDLRVDFPQQPNWTGLISEMEVKLLLFLIMSFLRNLRFRLSHHATKAFTAMVARCIHWLVHDLNAKTAKISTIAKTASTRRNIIAMDLVKSLNLVRIQFYQHYDHTLN